MCAAAVLTDWACPRCGYEPVLFILIKNGGHRRPSFRGRWVSFERRPQGEQRRNDSAIAVIGQPQHETIPARQASPDIRN